MIDEQKPAGSLGPPKEHLQGTFTYPLVPVEVYVLSAALILNCIWQGTPMLVGSQGKGSGTSLSLYFIEVMEVHLAEVSFMGYANPLSQYFPFCS